MFMIAAVYVLHVCMYNFVANIFLMIFSQIHSEVQQLENKLEKLSSTQSRMEREILNPHIAIQGIIESHFRHCTCMCASLTYN